MSLLTRNEWEKPWRKAYMSNNPAKRMLWAARRRAKVKGLPFDITEEDIVIPTHCPYTGIELSTHVPRGHSRETIMSLDRIVPELGYIKGNIEVISHLANTMKSNATVEQLQSFAKKVLSRWS